MNRFAGPISRAASAKQWEECERLMFTLLYKCKYREQLTIAESALIGYAPTWLSKHPDERGPFILLMLHDSWGKHLEISFPLIENADPADAELENGIYHFSLASRRRKSQHRVYTTHFANCLRSAVLSQQVSEWMMRCPDSYSRWKKGLAFEGPTALDDQSAVEAGKVWWSKIEQLLHAQATVSTMPPDRQYETSAEARHALENWLQEE